MNRRLVAALVLTTTANAGQVPAPAPKVPVSRASGAEDEKPVLSIRMTAPSEAEAEKTLRALVEVAELRTVKRLDVHTPLAVSDRICGFASRAWATVYQSLNDADASEVKLPPCLPKPGPVTVTIPKGSTVSHQSELFMGDSGPVTMQRVATLNNRSVASLNDVGHDEQLLVPFVVSTVSVPLKEEIARHAMTSGTALLDRILKQVPAAIDASLGTDLRLVRPASYALGAGPADDCPGSPAAGDWPLPNGALLEVLKHNVVVGNPPLRQEAVIGIVDTGIVSSERRLLLKKSREDPAIGGAEDVDDDGNGWKDDVIGANMDHTAGDPIAEPTYFDFFHGTHVAGLALGGLSDSALTKQITGRLALRPLNVVSCSTDLGGTRCRIPPGSIEEAIHYANLRTLIPIVNVSLETVFDNAGTRKVIANTQTLVVAAAGNSGQDLDNDTVFPVGYSREFRAPIISVAAHGPSGDLWRKSNFGKDTVDLAAPGCQITSALDAQPRRYDGTSFAAPLVAFAAGLMYAEGLDASAIKQRILSTVDRVAVLEDRVATGGKLNIVRALSLHDDIVAARQGGVLRGIIVTPSCVAISSSACRPWRDVRRIELQPSGRMRVLTVVKSMPAFSNAVLMNVPSGSLTIRPDGASAPVSIQWSDITDVTPAAIRPTSDAAHPKS